jgi:LacI family transcriptional regulator
MADVGIRDVAAHAGVSVATASDALNHPERVSRRAAAVVSESARTLGYRPNAAARQLKTGRSFVLGLAVSDLGHSFTLQSMTGIEDAADKAGYSVLFGISRGSAEREARYLELFERNRVDGVLFAPRGPDLEVLAPFQNRGVPIVLIGAADAGGAIPSVTLGDVTPDAGSDDQTAGYAIGRAATELILSLLSTSRSRTASKGADSQGSAPVGTR